MSSEISSVRLDTSRPIDIRAVEAICVIPDDAYRLQWVSYAYYDLATRLAEKFGPNASWPAFARWSAYTISEALRLDEPNPRLEQVLRDHVVPARMARAMVEIQRRLRSLDDGAMPIVLALGNRMVFHEVGYTVAHFLEWIDGQEGPNAEAWTEYERGIDPFQPNEFFRPSYATWLREGMRAYYQAWFEDDPILKAQLVLKGNLLLGAYEQWRVDAFFEVALDFNPGAMVERLRITTHDSAQMADQLKVRHAGTRRAFRHQWAMINWASDAYAAFLTRYVLTWDAPLYDGRPTSVRLGCEVPDRIASPIRGSDLDPLRELGGAQRLFDAFDRSAGELRGVGARNFRRFTDRMSFIANLFREQQQNPHLLVRPSETNCRLLDLQLDDNHLDAMRKRGDKDGDERADAKLASPNGSTAFNGNRARRLLHDLKVDLPEWATKDDQKRIHDGQKFFFDNALPIASALFCASLPMAYTAAKGARVLLATAELVSDVERRIAETGRLLLDIMMPDPLGLAPGSRGYEAVRSVRGYHAAIRHLLKDQEPWADEWDETPINQEDLLGTLTTFTVVVLETLELMGVEVTPKQRDDYLHTWLVAGHLLGIDYAQLRPQHTYRPTVQPLNYTEMRLIRDVIFRRQSAPSASGQMLTRALIDMEEQALPLPLRPLPPAAIRRFIGDDAADLLEVPPAGPARVLIDALGPFGAASGFLKRGAVLRPRIGDMARALFSQWDAPRQDATATLPLLDQDKAALKLMTIDLTLHDTEEPLYLDEGVTTRP